MAWTPLGLVLLLVPHATANVLEATSFVPYPGYTGNLTVAGAVYLLDTGVGQNMFFHFSGVDTACTVATEDANSCGVHVHEGMTCEVADDIGGHYWNAAFVAADPWASVVYAVAGGESMTMGVGIEVHTGVSSSNNLGRAFVVHDSSGARVACALLQSASSDVLLTAPFMPYAGYTGALDQVEGSVLFFSSGGTQTMHYNLLGVDTGCNSTLPDVANACGVHIHVGTNCSVAAGGHNWNTAVVTDDPWLPVTYDASSGSAWGFAQAVVTGLSTSDVQDAVFVVHDSTGARIGCAEISKLEPTTTTTPDDGILVAGFATSCATPILSLTIVLAKLILLR